MADSKFKKGDVVQLASGGPKMTVSGPAMYGSGLNCEWFDAKGILKNGDFDPDILVKPTGPKIFMRKIER